MPIVFGEWKLYIWIVYQITKEQGSPCRALFQWAVQILYLSTKKGFTMAYTYPFKETDEKTKIAVWEKGKIVPDKDGKHWDP